MERGLAEKSKPNSKKWYLLIAIVAVLMLAVVSGTEGMNAVTKKPEFCTTCHVMDTAYISWSLSSHRSVGCNDCHIDHTSYVAKNVSKATSGIKHMYDFYFADIPETIRFKSDPGLVQENCLRCHGDLVKNTRMGSGKYCFDCHRSVPHGQ